METVPGYLLNCFLFLIPVFVWNMIFFKALPAPYQKPIWDHIPKPLAVLENVLRVIVFVLPVFLKMELSSPIQFFGLALYGFGLAVYFLSWILAIKVPNGRWSRSLTGFTAPAWTTVLWLAGIGLVGQHTWLSMIPYSFVIYIAIATVFVCIHTTHAFLAYRRQKAIKLPDHQIDFL